MLTSAISLQPAIEKMVEEDKSLHKLKLSSLEWRIAKELDAVLAVIYYYYLVMKYTSLPFIIADIGVFRSYGEGVPRKHPFDSPSMLSPLIWSIYYYNNYCPGHPHDRCPAERPRRHTRQ